MNQPNHLSEYIEEMPHLWVRFFAQRALAKAHEQAKITDGSIRPTQSPASYPHQQYQIHIPAQMIEYWKYQNTVTPSIM